MNSSGLTISDIRYVLKSILHNRKKYFLIVLIVGLLIGASLSVVLTLRESKANSQNNVVNTLEAAKASLGAERASQTESVYKAYTEFQDTLDSVNSSSVLSLRSKSGVESVLTYYVDSKNNADSVVNAIEGMFFTDQLSNDINAQLKTKIDESSLKDYINFDIKNNVSKNSNSSNDDVNASNRVFTVTIFAKNKTQLSIINTNTTKQINKIFKKLTKINSGTKYYLLQSSVTKISDADLLAFKSFIADNVSNISSTMSSLKGSLDEDQQAYLTQLLSSSDSNSSKTTVNSKNAKVQFFTTKIIKFSVLGAVGFEVLYILILLVLFVLSDKIHSPQEVKDVLKLKILSFVRRKEDMDMLVNELNYSLKENKENVAITSTLDSKEMLNQMDAVVKDCSVELINQYPKNEGDYDRLSNINSIILFEKIGQSDLNEIKRLIDYYNAKHISVENIALFE